MLFSQGTTLLYLRRVLRLRVTKMAMLLFCLFNVLDVVRIHHKLGQTGAQSSAGQHERHHGRAAPPAPGHQRVYMASMHFNNGEILRSHWNQAVLDLTETLGPENVFVSIFESGSWDDSKELLRELDDELGRRGVPRRVDISDTTHQDELDNAVKGEGWVVTPRRQKELRRIPYLAKLRNKTIRDLVDLHRKGVVFDKVLFLNDVVFTV